MIRPTIFYAWQSDRSKKVCRYFIRDAANAAIKELVKDADIVDSPRLDSDTQEVPGHPEIARTIFGKIDDGAIFLADLTLTGQVKTFDGRKKRVANANVLLELGHASARMGWERMVLVMNEAFGKAENQLFDILHRRHPNTYRLPDNDNGRRLDAKASLTAKLKLAFKAAFAAEHDKVTTLIRRLDVHCLRLMYKEGNSPYFSGPPPNTFSLGAANGLDTPSFNAAVSRLLDMELIHSEFDPTHGVFAYHWTYWGNEVLRSLKVRQSS